MKSALPYLVALLSAARLSTQQLQVRESYDYIIAGGGTAGLTVAARLAEANATVLVVEIGTDAADASFWGYSQTLYNMSLTLWTGKGLGGSSSMNGEIYLRAEAGQIDDWEKAGNPGWNWENLFPYYLKSETFVPPNDTEIGGGATYVADYHGFDGPVNTGWSPELDPNGDFVELLKQSGETIGLPAIDDANGGAMRGTSTWPRTMIKINDTEVREDSWTAYIEGVDFPNLDVLTEATALSIVWGDQDESGNVTAVGVNIAAVASNSTIVTVKANKEVILAAGAYRSSSILEFSGVGNPAILTPLGIETVVDLPGVGEHLIDQPENTLSWYALDGVEWGNGKTGYVVYPNATDLWGDDTAAVAADLLAALPDYAAQIAAENSGAATAEDILPILQIQYESIFNSQIPFSELLAGLQMTSGHASHQFWTTTPFSQGSVHINTSTPPTDGGIPITVTNRFWDLPWDVTAHVAAARYVRKIYGASPLVDLLLNESSPGLTKVPLDASDDTWMDWVLSSYSTTWHPVGTTPMLPKKAGGVVSPELVVYGTSNVRVVDASVFPFQVNGHPSSTVYAVAERAADIIKASPSFTKRSPGVARRGEGAPSMRIARAAARGRMVKL